MLAGYAPFCSKKTNEVCHKVINFEKYLKFPTNCKASKECRDLIYKLVCNPDSRLGKNGSSEIKAHPFFKGINWLKIKEMDESACINRLMALEGAIQNIRWHDLSEDDKKNLKEFYILQKQ